MTATRKLLKLGLVYLDGPSLQHHTPTPSLFSHSNCVKNTIHKASPLHHDPRWVSLSGTSSSCSLYLPFVNTNCTASTSYSPFLYSKDNTLWIESRSPRALDMNCTVSIFSLFFFFFLPCKTTLRLHTFGLWFQSRNFIPNWDLLLHPGFLC